jgi:FkbM family methyltransferase
MFDVILGRGNSLVAVDIGGAAGLQPHWNKIREVTRFLVYEPHAESYNTLLNRQAVDTDYNNFLYLNEALSGKGGPRTLYQTNVPTGSSLLPLKKGGFGDHAYTSYFNPITTRTIETTTLTESLDREGIERVDMIKLDTQGTELEILSALNPERFAEVLAVESEVALIEIYDGPEAAFEDMFRLMREREFSLFDLRTNRFLGNAVRLKPGDLEDALGKEPTLPPNALRLAEVDAVFMRDPRSLLASGADAAKIRRLIAILLTYHFIPEAVYCAMEARERRVLTGAETEEIINAIRHISAILGRETEAVAEAVRRTGGSTWAQYMWVPYPSF